MQSTLLSSICMPTAMERIMNILAKNVTQNHLKLMVFQIKSLFKNKPNATNDPYVCLIETVILSTHKICFGREIWKIVFHYALLSGGLILNDVISAKIPCAGPFNPCFTTCIVIVCRCHLL